MEQFNGYALSLMFALGEDSSTSNWQNTAYWIYSHFNETSANMILQELEFYCTLNGTKMPQVSDISDSISEGIAAYNYVMKHGGYVPDIGSGKILPTGTSSSPNPDVGESSGGSSTTGSSSSTKKVESDNRVISKTEDSSETEKEPSVEIPQKDVSKETTNSTQEVGSQKVESVKDVEDAAKEDVNLVQEEVVRYIEQPIQHVAETKDPIIHTQAIQRRPSGGYGR